MLNNAQKDLLTSIIIGDGYMAKDKKYESYYIAFGHGAKQKDYCEWKINLINNAKIFNSELVMHTKIVHLQEKNFLQYNTKKCGYCLKFLYDQFIIDGKKNVKAMLPMMKTKQAVSIWFMDDGSIEEGRWKDKNGNKHITRPSIKLCTHSFSYEENVLIQKWFKNKFGLVCSIKQEHKKNKTYYYLRFGTDESEKLYKEILLPYVKCCESMQYKFRHCIERYG